MFVNNIREGVMKEGPGLGWNQADTRPFNLSQVMKEGLLVEMFEDSLQSDLGRLSRSAAGASTGDSAMVTDVVTKYTRLVHLRGVGENYVYQGGFIG